MGIRHHFLQVPLRQSKVPPYSPPDGHPVIGSGQTGGTEPLEFSVIFASFDCPVGHRPGVTREGVINPYVGALGPLSAHVEVGMAIIYYIWPIRDL